MAPSSALRTMIPGQVGLDGVRVVAEGLDHPECVAVGPDCMLYAGGEAGQIYRIDPKDGNVEVVAETGGWALGIAVDANRDVVVCDAKRKELLLCTESRQVEVVSRGDGRHRLRTPNYAVLLDWGVLFSDSGDWGADNGCIYKVSEGKTTIFSTALTAFPNGMAIDSSGRYLYVALSTAPSVWRIPLTHGRAAEPELVVDMPGTVPDGLAFDQAGGLYISCYRPDRIYRLSPDGALEVVVDDFQGTVIAAPTNIAFGGDDSRTMFIASLARWHIAAVRVDVPGLRVPHPGVRVEARAGSGDPVAS